MYQPSSSSYLVGFVASISSEDGYYFRPRLDTELLLSLPADDVFVTTACIAFWHYDDIEDIVVKLHEHFKDNFMLEIQYHKTAMMCSPSYKVGNLMSLEKIGLCVPSGKTS